MFLQCKTLFLSRKEYLQISHNLCFTSLVFTNFGQTIIEYIENKFKFNNFGINFHNLTKSLASMWLEMLYLHNTHPYPLPSLMLSNKFF